MYKIIQAALNLKQSPLSPSWSFNNLTQSFERQFPVLFGVVSRLRREAKWRRSRDRFTVSIFSRRVVPCPGERQREVHRNERGSQETKKLTEDATCSLRRPAKYLPARFPSHEVRHVTVFKDDATSLALRDTLRAVAFFLPFSLPALLRPADRAGLRARRAKAYCGTSPGALSACKSEQNERDTAPIRRFQEKSNIMVS